jgi:hypothetical protein
VIISKQIKRPNDGPISSRADIAIKERRGPPETAGSRVTYRVDQELGASPAAEGLASLLTRMGIEGAPGLALLERVELLIDPAPALAWWWYALVQEGVERPAAVVFNCLVRNKPPHPDYLALVRSWPGVTAGDRVKIEKMLLRGAGAEALSARWSKHYPGLNDGAFVSYMWLYGTAPAELGYAKAQGAWARI